MSTNSSISPSQIRLPSCSPLNSFYSPSSDGNSSLPEFGADLDLYDEIDGARSCSPIRKARRISPPDETEALPPIHGIKVSQAYDHVFSLLQDESKDLQTVFYYCLASKKFPNDPNIKRLEEPILGINGSLHVVSAEMTWEDLVSKGFIANPRNSNELEDLVRILGSYECWALAQEVVQSAKENPEIVSKNPESPTKLMQLIESSWIGTKGRLLEAIERCYLKSNPTRLKIAQNLFSSACLRGLFSPHSGLSPEAEFSARKSNRQLRKEFAALVNSENTAGVFKDPEPFKGVLISPDKPEAFESPFFRSETL